MKSPITRFLFAAAIALTACASPSATENPDADTALPEVASATADGRGRYLVRLRPVAPSALRLRVTDPRFGSYHASEVIQAVQRLERAHGIAAAVVLSRSTQAFAAMLTPAEVERLRRDPGVAEVGPDELLSFSSDAHSVWLEQPDGTEIRSWGKQAVGGRDANGGGLPVYIVDTGVLAHADLNVTLRVNAVSPNNPAHALLPSCHAHGTHVAGIIGARAGSGGVRGIAPGIPMISVSVLDPTTILNGCLPNEPRASNVAAALEWVRADLASHKFAVTGVVNLSINGQSSPGQLVHEAIKHLATPKGDYPGALVVQSAGNQFTSACSWAYNPTSGSDGVIVVGAINDHGQTVRPLQGFRGFHNEPVARDEAGSNYGSCVEMWAPGAAVMSTFSGGDRQRMGGTSMAAPHVTGLAAAIGTGLTSMATEAQVAATLQALNTNDAAGLAVRMPSTAHLPPGLPRNRPYGELWAIRAFNERIHPGQPINIDENEPLGVWFGSSGAPGYSCSLDRRSPAGVVEHLATTPSGHYPGLMWSAGTWQVYSSCLPAAATVTSRPVLPAPSPRWLVNGVLQSDGASLTLPETTTATLGFQSSLAVRCDIHLAWGPTSPSPPYPGYPLLDVGTSGTTTLQRTPAAYHYALDCFNAIGDVAVTHLLVRIDQVPLDAAAYVSQTVPITVTAGAAFTAAVTMRNTGNTRWSNDAGYRLGSQNPGDNTTWGPNRLFFTQGEEVAPQAMRTFSATFTAPTTPGTYAFQWRMVRETIAWFGATTPSVSVTVGPAGCVNPVCTPESTRTSACGNCGSQVDTCSASCQWVAGSCGGEGVCAPGDSADCCPNACGACQCPGVRACSATCQWGICEGATCAPPCN